MRSLSDCIGDMLRTRVEDREIEYLLARQPREDNDGLVSLLATLDLELLDITVDDHATDFAAAASRLVLQAEPVMPIRPARSRVVPRLATAALTAVLLIGLTGVAQAADASAPGDALYPLDRALEEVGINDGGLDERLDEAQALADDSQSTAALVHLAKALENSSPNASDALERAAERDGLNDNPSQAVRESVADMLEWMATREVSRKEFGQGVAQRAREIGAGHAGPPPATLPDNASQNQDNTGNQGNQGNQDEPDDNDDSPTGSSSGGGNSGGDNSGRSGGSGSDHGPPGGSPPGQSGK
jgi:hypothetical protein